MQREISWAGRPAMNRKREAQADRVETKSERLLVLQEGGGQGGEENVAGAI